MLSAITVTLSTADITLLFPIDARVVFLVTVATTPMPTPLTPPIAAAPAAPCVVTESFAITDTDWVLALSIFCWLIEAFVPISATVAVFSTLMPIDPVNASVRPPAKPATFWFRLEVVLA